MVPDPQTLRMHVDRIKGENEMTDVNGAVEMLMAAGLPCTPPHVLVTRWLALLADDDHLYLDVAYESGARVPGTRYAFVAVTDAAVCYLQAEHDDDDWDQQRVSFNPKPQALTPRTLVAWRRPLTLVTEVGLGGDTWQWVGEPEGIWKPPCYALRFGDDAVEIPLRSPHRSRQAPDPTPVIAHLTAAWRASSSRP